MRLIPVGVGKAGSKIADQLASYSDESKFDVAPDALTISATKPALLHLRHLPKQRRVLVGQDITGGHGVGRDNKRGAAAMNDDISDVFYRLNEINVEASDGFLLTLGLGGGMGSGGAPVLAKYLQEEFDKPVYAVAILPNSAEPLSAAYNTMRSLRTLVHHTENIILYDNDEWVPEEEGERPRADTYRSLNTSLVINIAHLLAVANPEHRTQSSVSTEDMIHTLEAADFSTIGYADRQLERLDGGFLSSLRGGGDAPEDTSDDVRIVLQEAALGRLTAPVSLSAIEAVFAAIAGPPEFFSRRGIEDAQEWLADQTDSDDIRIGEYPIDHPAPSDDDGEYMSGVVLFSGLTIIERFIEIYDRVVGVDTLAGMRGQIQATEVMEAFFADADGPEPLFTTDEHDASELRSVDSDIDVDTDVSETDADMPTQEDEFDWRSPQTPANDDDETTADEEEGDNEDDGDEESSDSDRIAGANMFFGSDSEKDFDTPEDDPAEADAENAEIFFDNDGEDEDEDTQDMGMFDQSDEPDPEPESGPDDDTTPAPPHPSERPNAPDSADTSTSDMNDEPDHERKDANQDSDGEEDEENQETADETDTDEDSDEFFEEHG